MTVPSTDAVVVLDRLESASSAADATASLQSILKGLQTDWDPIWLWHHEDLPDHLVHILQHAQLKTTQTPVDDECVALVLRIYQHLSTDRKSLILPAPARYLEALLDVMDRPSASTYTRVLALQRLEQVSKFSEAQDQWLQAPNGVHRLADSLTQALDNPLEEPVRTQALQVAHILAQQSSPIAKVFVFAEVETKLLDATWHVYGGLTKGNPMVADVLRFIKTLLQQVDASIHELVLQRPTVGPRLAQLLDLRGGHEFLHPEEYLGKKQQASQSQTAATPSKPIKDKPKLGPLSARKNKRDEEDDLDTLLQTATASTNTQSQDTAGTTSEESQQQRQPPSYPQLLPAEETLISLVLDIVDILLEKDELRRAVWSTYAPGVCLFIWEMALMTPPPPGTTAFFALPSCQLQQKSLELVASKLCDTALMDRIRGLDRLLEVVCTGGGLALSLTERLGCSQAALAVLRNVLDSNRIHEILLHTLAPPPILTEDDDIGAPPPPTVVQKLWNTVAANLQDGQGDSKVLFLSGALGGLSVFAAADAESREMLFQVIPPLASIDHMLEVLVEASSSTFTNKDGVVSLQDQNHTTVVLWSIYRFLAESIYASPRLVQTLLSSPSSTQFATLATTTSSINNTNHPQLLLLPMVYLILGLCMEYFPSNVQECGGWSQSTILELLQSIGISKVTKSLEEFKAITTHSNKQKKKNNNSILALSSCALEAKTWQAWYDTAVWTVRKRIVRELAGRSSSLEDDDGDEADSHGRPTGTTTVSTTQASTADTLKVVKPLQRLIAQQTTELEDLRLQLQQATSKITSQERQLETWERRIKSNPTELDRMLNDLTTKNANLEEQIVSLQTMAQQAEQRHQEQMAAMTQQINEQRDVMTQRSTVEHELRDDRDRLSQELQALSQAYTSLEEEYRRSSSMSSASTAVPTTPQQGPVSTEVATLRAENARLRHDAKAADDWMAMAVQRMNEMGSANGQLQQEVTSLKEELAAVSSHQYSTQQNSSQWQQQQVDELNRRLVHQEQEFQAKVNALEGQIQQEHEVAASLREQLIILEKEKTTSEQQWQQKEQQLVQETKELLGRLEEQEATSVAAAVTSFAEEEAKGIEQQLQVELTVKSAEIVALQTQLEQIRESLKGELDAKEAEIALLQTALEQAKGSQSVTTSESMPTTVTTEVDTNSIQMELEAARKEMAEMQHRTQQEIYKKESIIRELEDRLGSGLGPYKMEDIRDRDEEIEELRAANEAAQEWMTQAVEHHNMLQEKVATLTEEKAALVAQQQQAQLASLHTGEAAVKLLEHELQEKSKELETMQQQLNARETELIGLRAEFEASQSLQQNVGIAREDFQIVEKQLEEARAKAADLEAQLSDKSDLETRVEEFQSWADLAQAKIAELIAAKEQADNILRETKGKLQAKELELESLEKKANLEKSQSESQLAAETEADRSVIEQLRSEIEEWKAASGELSKECNNIRNDYAQLQKDYDELQAWTDGAQQRIFEVVSSKEKLEVAVGELTQRLEAANAALSLSSAEAESGDEVNGANESTMPTGERTDDVDAMIEQLKEQLQSKDQELSALSESLVQGEQAISQWAQRVNELEAELSQLTSQADEQKAETRSELVQLQETHLDAQQRVHQLENEVARLQQQLLVAETRANSDALISAPTGLSHDSTIDAADFFGAHSNDEHETTATSEIDLNELLRQKEKELRDATEALARDEDVVRQWEERVAELEAEIDSLQTRAQEQEEEASAAILLWQEAHAEAERKCTELEAELARATLDETVTDDQDLSLPAESGPQVAEEITRLREELRAANDALAADQDVVQQWEDQCTQLETTIASLTVQIEEEQKEANEVITRWQESFNEADSKCTELEQELANVKKGVNTLQVHQEELAQLQARLAEKEREIEQLKNQASSNTISQNAAVVSSNDALLFFDSDTEQPGFTQSEAPEVNESVVVGNASVEQDRRVLLAELESHVSSLREKEEELQLATQRITETEQLVEEWKSRSEKLEGEVQSLVARLEELENESDETIRTLQAKCGVLEDRCSQLQESNDNSWADKVAAEKFAQDLTLRSSLLEQRVDELDMKLKATTEELSFTKNQLSYTMDDKRALSEKVLSLETSIANISHAASTGENLKDILAEKEAELAEMKQALSQDEAVVKQWEDRVKELESELSHLQEQLVEQENEANSAIEQWQTTYADLEIKCSELEVKLANADDEIGQNAAKLADRDWTIEQLQAEVKNFQTQLRSIEGGSEEIQRLEDELAVERGRHREAREEVETLTQSLNQVRTELTEFRCESETVVAQWTERVDELERQVAELDGQLAQQDTEANEAITSWEDKCKELDRELDIAAAELKKANEQLQAQTYKDTQLEEQVAKLSEDLLERQSTIVSLESERKANEEKLHSAQEKLSSMEIKCEELTATERSARTELEAVAKELEQVRSENDKLKEIQLAKSRDKLEEERDRLTIVIAQLEEELNEANNMIQAHITDGSSDRATEVAAHALREEIDELKVQVQEWRLAAEDESYKRGNAEKEIERLRDDIAALVSLNEHENLSEEIHQRTAKAVERLKMKERIEIDQLRKSLYRSIEETETAREGEKQANEQLSKLRLQTAVVEQEIIAAKSEILFLTQALDELRMNEESKRASLEYRIGSLEDENAVLRKYHSSELETVRNELAQISMEKDRILHQLRESEKTNAALVFASTKVETSEAEDVADLDSEIAKLRIENAHLLTVAADDKARAERRLREALAAHRATAEADTILEQELRLAAESSIQSLKAQLEEYRNVDRREGTSRDDGHRAMAQAQLDKLADELEELRHELQKVKKENAALRSKLEHSASKSKAEIAALTEECRLAQMKAQKFEREGRYDAAVKSEMSRLHVSPEKRGPYSSLGNSDDDDDPALERVNPPYMGSEAFDLIRRQKEEIQEERKMYLEFLAEHDDLLALLAQNDLERECLKEALSRTVGADGLEEVLREAEGKALEQFGNIIKVT